MTDRYAQLRADLDAAQEAGWKIAQIEIKDVRSMLADLDRMREALQYLIEKADDSDGCQYGTLSTKFVRDTARAALSQGEPK